MQEELRSRAEQEVRLQQIGRWIADQNRWIRAARTPSSRAELRRSRAACQVRGHPTGRGVRGRRAHLCVCVWGQDLQLKAGHRRDLLQELSGEEHISCEVVSQAQMLIQMCEDLRSQVHTSAAPALTCSHLLTRVCVCVCGRRRRRLRGN